MHVVSAATCVRPYMDPHIVMAPIICVICHPRPLRVLSDLCSQSSSRGWMRYQMMRKLSVCTMQSLSCYQQLRRPNGRSVISASKRSLTVNLSVRVIPEATILFIDCRHILHVNCLKCIFAINIYIFFTPHESYNDDSQCIVSDLTTMQQQHFTLLSFARQVGKNRRLVTVLFTKRILFLTRFFC